MNPAVYPLVFKPLLKARVWGGTRLHEDFEKPLLDKGQPCGESWEIADLSGESCDVEQGQLKGMTLTDLVEKHEHWLMGRASLMEGRFPLLFKLIDARETLSVQVHPGEESAERFGGRPKTEAWVVLDVEPGSCLYLGLKDGVAPDDLRKACENNLVEGLLCRVDVRPMDVVFIPAGTVHAIGGGVLLAEIQQSSDTTYRLYDWGRFGLDGNPRKLHLEEAIQSIDFSQPRTWKHIRGLGRLIEGPPFVVEIVSLTGSSEYEICAGSPVCAMCLEGTISASCGSSDAVVMKRGVVSLIPAAAEKAVFRAKEEKRAKILISWPV